jgi:hypothetical protein
MMGRAIYILFNSYLLLWVTTFIDTGYLKSRDEATVIIQKVNLVTVIISVFVFPLVGKLSDKLPARILIPISFFLEAFAMMLF